MAATITSADGKKFVMLAEGSAEHSAYITSLNENCVSIPAADLRDILSSLEAAKASAYAYRIHLGSLNAAEWSELRADFLRPLAQQGVAFREVRLAA